MVIGAVIMLIISRNFHYMMNCYPDSGGVYAFAKETFGYDHGFLAAWFLILTYMAMLWANATSLPLFVRYFFGDAFRFGYMYQLFGYEVYLGEALLSIGVTLLIALLCAWRKKAVAVIMTVLVCVFTAGIVICFFGSVLSPGAAANAAGSDTVVHDVFERADALMYTNKNMLKEKGARTR